MKQFTILKKLGWYFLNGLLVILPLGLTFYLLNYLYKIVNKWGMGWLSYYPKVHFPGLGVLLVFIIVLFIGFIANLWITKKLLKVIELLICKIPIIKGLYSTLKETVHSFFGEKKSFDQVVLIQFEHSKRMGFLTVKEPIFKSEDGGDYVGVYFPLSLQLAGDLHWIEKSKVEKLNISVDDALRIILSAGVAGKK